MTDPWSVFAAFSLGLCGTNGLREHALALLKEPVDEMLLAITLCDDDDRPCIEKAAKVYFDRLGLADLATTDILRIYAADVSHTLMLGEISPRAAADLIASATQRHPVDDFHDLDTFRYASSEMQERPEDRALFETAILEEAAEWSSRRASLRRRP